MAQLFGSGVDDLACCLFASKAQSRRRLQTEGRGCDDRIKAFHADKYRPPFRRALSAYADDQTSPVAVSHGTMLTAGGMNLMDFKTADVAGLRIFWARLSTATFASPYQDRLSRL
jgi:hypothetical protein